MNTTQQTPFITSTNPPFLSGERWSWGGADGCSRKRRINSAVIFCMTHRHWHLLLSPQTLLTSLSSTPPPPPLLAGISSAGSPAVFTHRLSDSDSCDTCSSGEKYEGTAEFSVRLKAANMMLSWSLGEHQERSARLLGERRKQTPEYSCGESAVFKVMCSV